MGTVDRFIDTTALAPLKTLPLYQVLDTFLSRTVIPWSLTVFAFFVVYWLVPAKSIPWRVALIGGVVAGTLWNILKVGRRPSRRATFRPSRDSVGCCGQASRDPNTPVRLLKKRCADARILFATRRLGVFALIFLVVA